MNILFITYNLESTASCRYRSYFPVRAINQLQKPEHRAQAKLIYAVTKSDIERADVVVFQRVPQALWYVKRLHLPFESLLRSRIEKMVTHSLIQKKFTVVDIDDYIFLNEQAYQTGVSNSFFPDLIKRCHYVIISTPNLATYISTINKNVVTLPNALDFDLINRLHDKPLDHSNHRITKQLTNWKSTHSTIFGWVCGNAQTADFELFKTIFKTLKAKPFASRVRFLLIGGKDKLPKNLLNSDLIYCTGNLNWNSLPKIQSVMDVSLSILAKTEFNRYKSELKIVEPGYFKIPSICSKIGIAGKIIRAGSNGWLAETPDEWVEQISKLLDSNHRKTLGQSIQALVLDQYDLRKRAFQYLDFFRSGNLSLR